MVDPVKALKAYNRTTEVLEGLTADNERLRRLVQALEEENGRQRRAGERVAALLTRWATPDGVPEELVEAQAVLAAWDEVLGVPEAERCKVGPSVGKVTVTAGKWLWPESSWTVGL